MTRLFILVLTLFLSQTVSFASVDSLCIEAVDSVNALDGIAVSARKPLVTKLIDRINYDVQADPEVHILSMRDMMRKVPLITVESDGTIKVNGSSDFRIFKNGRPNRTLSKNTKEILASMPAMTIKRVEVITDPGAEFDAEGSSAILNFVTQENVVIQGVAGSVNASYSVDDRSPVLTSYLTTEIGKVTTSVFAGWARHDTSAQEQLSVMRYDYPDGSCFGHDNLSATKGQYSHASVEASYMPDSLNLLTAEVRYLWYGLKAYGIGPVMSFDPSGQLTGSYHYLSWSPSKKYYDINAEINYQHNTLRPGETFTLSYLLSLTNQHNLRFQTFSDADGIYADQMQGVDFDDRLRFYEHTFQADYQRRFGIHSINAGLKGILRLNRSTSTVDYFAPDYTFDKPFDHDTDIAAAYAQYSGQFGLLGLRAGLRYEWSHVKASYPDHSAETFGANFSDFVPSAAVNYRLDNTNTLTTNYSTSISRPGISYLDPSVVETLSSINYGNPDLHSSRRQSARLSYMHTGSRLTINSSASYTWTNDAVCTVRSVDGVKNVTTYANSGHTREVNLNHYMDYSFSSKTNVSMNLGVTYHYFDVETYKQVRWSPYASIYATQKLPAKISLSAHAGYSSYSINNVYQYSHSGFMADFNYGASLFRSFLKDNRLNVRVSLDNPFGPTHRTYETHINRGPYTGTISRIERHGLECRIQVAYRFGTLNASVRKTDASIKNDDLINPHKQTGL